MMRATDTPRKAGTSDKKETIALTFNFLVDLGFPTMGLVG